MATDRFNESLSEYLREHRYAVVATNRKAGPPQLTLVTYQYDGNDFVISTRGETQKAKNLRRRPEMTLAVIDNDGRQLIMAGRAEVVRDRDEVFRIHRERLSLIHERAESDEELSERLEREGRVALVFTPERHFPERLRRR
jgi:PPOX class probable F420-dependent enzyme